MGIRVGAIININKAWQAYQSRLAFYEDKLEVAQNEGDAKGIKYWQDSIAMTNAEIDAILADVFENDNS